jgi:hypothetical protein
MTEQQTSDFAVVQSNIEQIQKDICEIKDDNKRFLLNQEEISKILITHDTLLKVFSDQINCLSKDVETVKIGYYKAIGIVAFITFTITEIAPILLKVFSK